MLPRLRVGLRVWFAEVWNTHPHQVPHDQCCPPGKVYTSWGTCLHERLVGDDYCHASLACYCEEDSDCGRTPVPFFPARWARCQYPYGEPLQEHLVIDGVAGVVCGP
jgi:hypothetical protein